MSNSYNIGNSQNQISLGADIETTGLAASTASVFVAAGSDTPIVVARSGDATGAIPQQPMGDYTLLRQKRLSVFTKVSLTGSDAATRALEAASVAGTYTITGGDDGTQTFTNPTRDYRDPTVFLNFLIDMQ